MKKNFFKKLALVLAFVMVATSVNVPAASAAAAPTFKSTKATVKVGQTKKYKTVNASKYSVKFKIGKTSVATIRYSAGSKAVKVTGVAEGTTTLRADFKSYSTKKTTTARIPVTVTKGNGDDVTPSDAVLSGVTQTASNAFTATFTGDASQKFTKDDFSVSAVDGTTVLSVKSVEYAADGLSAKVTLYGNFADGVSYNVSCKDVTFPINATVGAVTRIAINTASAQQNVATPIDFTLFDATGIDVTPSVDLDANCIVTITGSYSGAEIDKASTAKITMDTIGSTAEVTVSYNTNAVGAEDVTATQTITCVDPKAIVGTKLFAKTGAINKKSGCAKFYLGISATVINVAENGTPAENVFFCAKDDNGDVISYDSYEAESSNDDVMSVSVTKDSGKYAQFTVSGNSKGNAQINITATKNGKASYYTIPVSVSRIGEAVKMTVSVTRPTMSNVDDSDYSSTIRATLYDALGEKVTSCDADFEIITSTTGDKVGIEVTDNGTSATVTARNAQAKTYTIKVTGSDNTTGATFVKNVNIGVKNLNAKDEKGDFIPLKLTYQIELNATALDSNPNADPEVSTDTLTAKLYATYNGLFAGYVRAASGSSITVAEGNVKASDDTTLEEVNYVVRYGTKRFTENLVGSGVGREDVASIASGSAITFKTVVPNADGSVYYNDDKDNPTLARNGSYTLQYELGYHKDINDTTGEIPSSKIVKKTVSFTVKNTMAIPTVTVLSRVVDDFTPETIKSCLKTNVDMNNNDSDHESIEGLTNDNTLINDDTGYSSDNLKRTIKYAVVVDDNWYFWVPINTTFRMR